MCVFHNKYCDNGLKVKLSVSVPMPAMTDISIDSLQRDDHDADVSKPADNPWIVDTNTPGIKLHMSNVALVHY